MTDLKAEKVPGEGYRIGLDGSVTELYGGVEISNGIGFSPDGTPPLPLRLHDQGHLGPRRRRRRDGVEPAPHRQGRLRAGHPRRHVRRRDGDLWVAHVGGRRVAKLDPEGNVIDEIPVPAKAVTSVAFGGPDWSDMYIVTADNLEDAAKGGDLALPARASTATPRPSPGSDAAVARAGASGRSGGSAALAENQPGLAAVLLHVSRSLGVPPGGRPGRGSPAHLPPGEGPLEGPGERCQRPDTAPPSRRSPTRKPCAARPTSDTSAAAPQTTAMMAST